MKDGSSGLSCSTHAAALVFGAAAIAVLAWLCLAWGATRPSAAAEERVEATVWSADVARYHEDLGRLLDFSASDLEANRQGRYSLGQWLSLVAWFVGFGCFAFLIGYFLLAFVGIIAPFTPRVPWFVRVLLALGAVILEVAVARAMWIVARDLLAAGPCQASGPLVSLEIVSAGRTGVAWEVAIAEHRCRGPRLWDTDGREIARIGEPHCVYCACASQRLLSLELLPPEHNDKVTSERRAPSNPGERAP